LEDYFDFGVDLYWFAVDFVWLVDPLANGIQGCLLKQ
jgi:hypothetical protein